MIAPGTVVSGYRIDRVVGSGGMGTVYAAHDPRLPRLDALKILRAELSADPDFRSRFKREADIAATLDHPHIVSIYDRGQTDDGRLWIAMQLSDGTDAEQALRDGQMPVHRAVNIVSAVGDALDYAHQRGVIHRDIKPANFLISAPGHPDERVLLGDFGIARALDDVAITAAASVMATAAFAPPEVSSGGGLDARSDLYSLGASFYRLLTGRSPFDDAEGVAAQMLAHVRQPPPRVSDHAPWLGDAFDEVVATAMAKDPAARYQTGREFVAAAVAALRQPRGRSVPVDELTTPAVRPAHLGSSEQPPATGSSWAQPAPPRRRRRSKVIAAAALTLVIAAAVTAVLMVRGNGDHAQPPPTATATDAPPPPVSAVADTDLTGLALSADQISAAVGVPLTAEQSAERLDSDHLPGMPIGCVGALLPALQLTYDNSGYRAFFGQAFNPSANGTSAFEGLLTFPTADLASTFVTRQFQLWKPCADKTVTLFSAANLPRRDYLVATPQFSDGVLSMVATRDGKPLACQHALTSRENVVVDVSVCASPGVDNQAVRVASDITAKIH